MLASKREDWSKLDRGRKCELGDLLKDPKLERRFVLTAAKHKDLGSHDYVDSRFRLEKA